MPFPVFAVQQGSAAAAQPPSVPMPCWSPARSPYAFLSHSLILPSDRSERLHFWRMLGPPGRAQQERPQPPCLPGSPSTACPWSPLRSSPSPEGPSERIRNNCFLLQGGRGHTWCVPSGFFCFGFIFIF